MASYLASIGHVMTWVNADDSVDVGIVLKREIGIEVEWIGLRTWNEIAGDTRLLVTRGQRGELLELWCSGRPTDLLEDLEDDDAPLSSHEAWVIIRTLEETGQGALALRLAPILDRCTKTDPPPALPDAAPAAVDKPA